MSRKQQRTEAELKEAAIDVAFEFKMLRQGWYRLDVSSATLGNNNSAANIPLATTPPTNAATSLSTANNNAPLVQVVDDMAFHNIEGILIHYRNLIEFFFSEKTDDDLVLACHYTGASPKQAPPWAKAYRLRCNNLLAHLTYRRTAYRQKDEHHWPDIWEQCRFMNDEITAFLNSLPPERRAWFT
jgi:hypothetical protein